MTVPSVGDILTIWDRILGPLSSKIPAVRRRLTAQRLRKLACGVQVSFLARVIGHEAQFVNPAPGRPEVEHVFVLRDAYVQAVVDVSGKVLWFAVTTRSKRFHPTLNYCPGPLPAVELGRTPFTALGDLPDGVMAFLGARRMGYAESVYLGNPGHYQTYVFAQNDGGYVAARPDYSAYFGAAGQWALNWFGANDATLEFATWQTSARAMQLQAEATINTYAVVGVGVPAEAITDSWWRVPFGFGPDKDGVRAFAE
jgi:hypothetical protein